MKAGNEKFKAQLTKVYKAFAEKRKRKCSITGYPYVNEYTGNPDLFPPSNQYKMF